MNPNLWSDPDTIRSVNELLKEALALPDLARDAWLRSLPHERQDLLPMLNRLLARASKETDTFLRRPIGVTVEDLDQMAAPADQAGDGVGPYSLIRELGCGGMATVWLADRVDGSMQRQVALKLPRPGWGLGLAERMVSERDILATLEHPHIARLYDAGSTDLGRPYLAMEYVVGQPIDAYARERALSVADRVRLILQVAAAVAHAHGRLVVHRDLKPSNILVTPDGEVRLLDFGVAKLLEGESTRDSRLTQLNGRAFTPDYASPEQIRGEPMTVASDVYSLAVVLYELLVGQLPYRLRRDSAAALEEAILEIEVLPASERVSERAASRELRGDLDNVLLKAMKKAPTERYASMEAFAEDLNLFLQGRPVSAVRDSLGYRTKRFVQRNRWAMAASTLVVTAILGGSGAALWQAHEATVQGDRALQRLARNAAVSEFLEVMFSQAVPEGQGNVIREMLKRSETYALNVKAHEHEPEQRAAVLQMLATQYSYMAEPTSVNRLLDQARVLLQDSADRDLQAEVSCAQAVNLALLLGRNEEALSLLEPWLDAPDIDHSVAASCLYNRAGIARTAQDADQALSFSRRAIDRLSLGKAPSRALRVKLQVEYGNALQINARPLAAEKVYERAMADLEAMGRGQAADSILLLGNWSANKVASGDVLGGLGLCQRAMRLQEQQQGGPSSNSLAGNCAFTLDLLARDDDALRLYGKVLDAAQSGGNVNSQVYALAGQSGIWLRKGDLGRAAGALDKARDALDAAAFPSSSVTRLRYVLARAAFDLKVGEARKAIDALDAMIGLLVERKSRNGSLAAAYRLRSVAHRALGEPAAALADATAARDVSQRLQGDRPHSLLTGLAWLAIAEIQRDQGHSALSRQAAKSAQQHLRESAGADHPATVKAGLLVKAT